MQHWLQDKHYSKVLQWIHCFLVQISYQQRPKKWMSVTFSFYSKFKDFSAVRWVSRVTKGNPRTWQTYRQLNTNFLFWLFSLLRIRPKIQKLEHRSGDDSICYQHEATSESVCSQAIVSTKHNTAGLTQHLCNTSISWFCPLEMHLLRSPALSPAPSVLVCTWIIFWSRLLFI